MAILERILSIILPVLIIVTLGYGYARMRGETVTSDMGGVNRVSMGVLAPLLVFTALAGKDFSLAQHGALIIAGVVISLGSGVLAWPIARYFGYDLRTFLPPMMYNNCGNMGLPLAVLAFGAAALPAAVALFVASTMIYFTVGIHILQKNPSAGKAERYRFLLSPMMLGMVAGILSSLIGVVWPGPLFHALKMLGEACIPLMLFALGVRMREVSLRSWRIGLVGAAVCPITGLAIAALLDGVLTLEPQQRAMMYLFAALPPAVLCFMLAEQYRQEPDKVASIVLLGNISSLVFVPVGLWLGLRP
jgi:predicted permease